MKRLYRLDFRKAPPDPLQRKLQWAASLLLGSVCMCTYAGTVRDAQLAARVVPVWVLPVLLVQLNA